MSYSMHLYACVNNKNMNMNMNMNSATIWKY